MKYLYKILRLFFCPHKYKKTVTYGPVTEDGSVIGNYRDKECRYCGRIKRFQNIA